MSLRSVESFQKRSKKLKNVLKKRYGPSGNKEEKLKNVLKKRYSRSGRKKKA